MDGLSGLGKQRGHRGRVRSRIDDNQVLSSIHAQLRGGYPTKGRAVIVDRIPCPIGRLAGNCEYAAWRDGGKRAPATLCVNRRATRRDADGGRGLVLDEALDDGSLLASALINDR